MSVSSRIRALSRVAITVAAVCCGLAVARTAFAQTPTFSIDALSIGDCQVVVQIESPRPGDQVGIVIDQTLSQEQAVVAGRNRLTFGLGDPLRPLTVVRVRVNGVEVAKAETPAKGGSSPDGVCAALRTPDDSPFDASAFIGTVVENFAPDNVGAYQNPEAGSQQQTKWIFGFNFDYRALGAADSRFQLYFEGETMHGVRTADIDCSAPDEKDRPPVCEDPTPGNVIEQARFILENASSLEAWISPRFEFHTLQFGSETPARVYATASFGFVALKDAPEVYRTHHIGGGFTTKEGPFEGSYLEGGWGKNELFSDKWNRLKVSGGLSFSINKIPVWRDFGRLFVEMTLDNDLGEGADSIRTFFGIDIDLAQWSD